MDLIYLGTPEFAVNPLRKLIEIPWINLKAIVTQPDRPANRGKKIISPPVKVFGLENNIEVLQTPKIKKDKELIQKLIDLKPDYLITCAFGQLLSQEVLDIATTLNIHASLLPKYRGAAPINWAIINGESETGITIMQTELSLDTGPILHQKKCKIGENETSVDLFEKLSVLGAEALIEALELLKNGEGKFTPQDDSKSTYAHMLKKEMGQIDWAKPATEIHNQIRGLQPWPSAYTTHNGKTVKVWNTTVSSDVSTGKAGTLLEVSDSIAVQTGNGILNLHTVQPENKKAMAAKDWANGARISKGEALC